MRNGIVALSALAVSLLLWAAPAIAHHSFAAEFDSSKTITLRGIVTKIDWTNPHVWFYVNVKEEGKITNWGFEMGPPHGLQRRGWNRDTMKIGDEVIINGTLAKNGTKRVNTRDVTMAKTGQKLGAASSENGEDR